MLSLGPRPNLCCLVPLLLLLLLFLLGGARVRARRLGGGRRLRLRALVALCDASRDSRHSCNAWSGDFWFGWGINSL
jgi:hypothetical protein